jgi:hypothetical protein
MSTTMKRQIIYFVIAVAVILTALVFSLPLKKQRIQCKISQCAQNLWVLGLGKERWADDNGKTMDDTPTWDDLSEYMSRHFTNGHPVCPDGGIYTLGRVGEPPKCSIGGIDHTYIGSYQGVKMPHSEK